MFLVTPVMEVPFFDGNAIAGNEQHLFFRVQIDWR